LENTVKNFIRTALATAFTLLLGGAPAVAQQPNRLVVIGDSISAGFAGGNIFQEAQEWAYPALIAEATGEVYSAPLIAGSIGVAVPNLSTGHNPYPDLPGPVGRLSNSPATNLAVPAETLRGALRRLQGDPTQIGTYFATGQSALGFHTIFNGIPWLFVPPPSGPIVGSQVDLTAYLAPRTVIVWIGANDVLGAALEGLPLLATTPEEFASDYQELALRLRAMHPQARLVFANIPDVGSIPRFQTTAGADALLHLAPGTTRAILGAGRGDLVNIVSYALFLRGLAPRESVAVLTRSAQNEVARRIAAFNATIRAAARSVGAAHVDANATLDKLQRKGLKVRIGREKLTLGAGYGEGVFSYDGVHLSKTGHAMVANDFIRALIGAFHDCLEEADIDAIAATDPHVTVLLPIGAGACRDDRGHDRDDDRGHGRGRDRD